MQRLTIIIFMDTMSRISTQIQGFFEGQTVFIIYTRRFFGELTKNKSIFYE